MTVKNDSITSLFQSSYATLHRYLKRYVKSTDTANDIAQEAFLRTIQYEGELGTPRAFLFTTARNLACDYQRHNKKVKIEPLGDLDHIVFIDESPLNEDLLIALEQSERIRYAVSQLPPKCREIFTQRVFFGLSYRELAKRHNVSEKTVENHIARGLRGVTQVLRKSKEANKC